MDRPATPERERGAVPWQARIVIGLIMALAIATVSFTNKLLTERYTEATRNRSELRIALYSGNLLAELRKTQVIPQLLARDPALIGSLSSQDYQQTSQRLIGYIDEIGAASITLIDMDGRVVAATDRTRLGMNLRNASFFVRALRNSGTVFDESRLETGASAFHFARSLSAGRDNLGVIAVEVDLGQFAARWPGISDAVLVTNSEGEVILSTEPRWLGRSEEEALEQLPAPSAIERALRAPGWGGLPVEAYFRGDAVMRAQARVPFQGWRMTLFTPYSGVRERVNGWLAIEIMGFALLLALVFYVSSRRSALRAALFRRETDELRQLNDRLSREIAERERAEADLSAAEATLAQSSKLAALGEMSAAVSHELNQPLAAMKTYLAGAQLLLRRRRTDEALSSFQRIDDLIERMGAITRQLKSYARKGGEAFEPVDLRAALSGALAIMEPQLRALNVTVDRAVPDAPVTVIADRLRLEQVIINLLRNAADATKGADDPRIELLIAQGDTARLQVRDNGHGIADLDALFEPFYTTKRPGDGVGLGLAISSGIVTDLGGRLTARNAGGGGAVFEVQLPVAPGAGAAQAAE